MDGDEKNPTHTIVIVKREGGNNYYPVATVDMPYAFDSRDVKDIKNLVKLV